MDRVAVFVDAGYFFAQGSIVITGQKMPRGEIKLNIPKAIEAFEKFAVKEAKVPLLRIYWYDGTASGPSGQHMALANNPNIKMRLGFVNTFGEQKGVDSLIVTDMITLARNKAMSDAILLSGDEDLRVGVQQAQEFGIRIHLLGIDAHTGTPNKRSQSQFLIQEADSTHMWSEKEMSVFMSRFSAPLVTKTESKLPASKPTTISKIHSSTVPVIATTTPAPAGKFVELAKESANEVDVTIIEAVVATYESRKQIPSEIDRPLIGKVKRIHGILTPEEKKQIRTDFISALRARIVKKA